MEKNDDKLLSRNKISVRKVKVFLLASETQRKERVSGRSWNKNCHLDMRLNCERTLNTHVCTLSSYITHTFHKQFSLFPLLFLLISTFSIMLNIYVHWMHTIDSLLFTFTFYVDCEQNVIGCRNEKSSSFEWKKQQFTFTPKKKPDPHIEIQQLESIFYFWKCKLFIGFILRISTMSFVPILTINEDGNGEKR